MVINGQTKTLLASLAAVIVLAVELSTLEVRDLRERVRRSVSHHDLIRDRLNGTDFVFDREYGIFLERIGRAASRGRPVSLCIPRTNELYDYDAAYVLAPRPVRRDMAAEFGYRCPGPVR